MATRTRRVAGVAGVVMLTAGLALGFTGSALAAEGGAGSASSLGATHAAATRDANQEQPGLVGGVVDDVTDLLLGEDQSPEPPGQEPPGQEPPGQEPPGQGPTLPEPPPSQEPPSQEPNLPSPTNPGGDNGSGDNGRPAPGQGEPQSNTDEGDDAAAGDAAAVGDTREDARAEGRKSLAKTGLQVPDLMAVGGLLMLAGAATMYGTRRITVWRG